MSKIAVWIGGAILLAAAVAAALYFHPGMFQGKPAQQSLWTPVPRPPAARLSATVRSVREFGPWHLACGNKGAAPTRKFGFIQNLGITQSDNFAKVADCHVFIMMGNRKDPRRQVVVDFRYSAENLWLRALVAYTIFGREGEGMVVPPGKGDRPSAAVGLSPVTGKAVDLGLGGQPMKLALRICKQGHCVATLVLMPGDVDNVGSLQTIVVRLPAPAHGQPSEVDIPAQGLAPALAALRKLTPS